MWGPLPADFRCVARLAGVKVASRFQGYRFTRLIKVSVGSFVVSIEIFFRLQIHGPGV